MLRALALRLATGLLTLFLVTALVFVLILVSAGDPLAVEQDADRIYRLSPAQRAELERLYRLDEPVLRQYFLWLGDALRGDLGRSFHDRQPVTSKIADRIGVTFTLSSLSLLLMVLVSVPLGALAAFRPGTRWDRLPGLLTYALYALPVFWAGLLLQILFAVRLDWLPLYGLASDGAERMGALTAWADRAAHLVLPVLCLAYGGVAFLSRFVRSTLLDNAAVESSRAARARGLSEAAVLVRHGFRRAAVPLLTLAGFLLPSLVGGSVIVEKIFALPGLGRLFVDATFQRDVPVLMGLTLLTGAATLIGVIAADLAYLVLDPRTRRS